MPDLTPSINCEMPDLTPIGIHDVPDNQQPYFGNRPSELTRIRKRTVPEKHLQNYLKNESEPNGLSGNYKFERRIAEGVFELRKEIIPILNMGAKTNGMANDMRKGQSATYMTNRERQRAIQINDCGVDSKVRGLGYESRRCYAPNSPFRLRVECTSTFSCLLAEHCWSAIFQLVHFVWETTIINS
ncbi:hypothetical protein LguiA_003275 [Lonicera macranthoides]